MAFKWRDRVREDVSHSGDGNVVLSGSPPDSSYLSFASEMSDGDTTIVTIVGSGAFETCWVTFSDGSPDELVRGVVIESSNGDARVDFSAGVKRVFMGMPAKIGGQILMATNLSQHTNVGGF